MKSILDNMPPERHGNHKARELAKRPVPAKFTHTVSHSFRSKDKHYIDTLCAQDHFRVKSQSTEADANGEHHAHVECDLEITIKATTLTPSPGNPDIEWFTVVAEASVGGIPIAVSNPMHFQNPPIMVPDGTFRFEKGRKIAGSDEMVRVENHKEDLDEAIKLLVADCVRTHLSK